MGNNHILTSVLCILLILIALCVLFLMLKHFMVSSRSSSSAASFSSSSSVSSHTHGKGRDDCCEAKTNGHCGKIRLSKDLGPFQSGLNVQIIAAGFFDWTIIPFLDPSTGLPGPNPLSRGALNMSDLKHYISPIVTIQNQGSNPMSVGLFHTIHSPRGQGAFREALKIPPNASTTVSYWKLMEVWSNLGGSGLSPFPVQLAVAGEEAKGCYVISWCCHIGERSSMLPDVDIPPHIKDKARIEVEI